MEPPALDAIPATPSDPPSAAVAPATPHPAEDDGLARLRREIDRLDARLVRILARRLDAAREAAATRLGQGGPAVDAGREAAVVRRAAHRARRHGLEDEVVRAIFWRVIELSHRDRERQR